MGCFVTKSTTLTLCQIDNVYQKLLNLEMYEEAREIARHAERLQEEVQEVRRGPRGDLDPVVSDADTVVELLQMRTDLTRAVEAEDYAKAAEIRDRIIEIENTVDGGKPEAAHHEPKYRLGQCVVHSASGWEGVVCGIEWGKIEGDGEDNESKHQPLYQVLPSLKYWVREADKVAGAMVCSLQEDELSAPEPPATWKSEHGDTDIQHPYLYFLFYGVDGQGNFVPVKSLREKYAIDRWDVYGSEGEGDGS